MTVLRSIATKNPAGYEGFINLYKPQGITSHTCISRLRKLLKMKRIGHGGTLDPMATGVLPIAVGSATRLFNYFTKHKKYFARVQYGIITDTDDRSGKILMNEPIPTLQFDAVKQVLESFEGNIQQRPPHYSAIRIDGERMYNLARMGEIDDSKVKLRNVRIESMRVFNWVQGDYPMVDMEVECSEGTYVRSLGRDSGEKLLRDDNTVVGANVTEIERLESGVFHLSNSITLEEIEEQIHNGVFQCQALDYPLGHLPKVEISAAQFNTWKDGGVFRINFTDIGGITAKQFARVYLRSTQDFLGLAAVKYHQRHLMLKPKIVLLRN